MPNTRSCRWFACLLALFACRGAADAAEADAARLARQILDAAGVRGGLVVHLGLRIAGNPPGDGRLAAALHASDSFLVHGLDADARNVEAARKHIVSLGLYGPVAVDRLRDARLPYTDNLVNLIVVTGSGLQVPEEEILRVLAPDGVAIWPSADARNSEPATRNSQLRILRKPRPKEIDEWTHYLHDASNNAVAHDSVVGPPRRLQWVGSPRWSRHHDHMASMSALVSTGGRIFYIIDEGPTSSIQLPPKWGLIARDAFNGTVLWKRPIASWYPHLWPLKSGLNQLPRRLVAVGDRVYVTLGLEAPVSVLDAATGQALLTCKGTEGTEEIIASDGVLFLLVGYPQTKAKPYRAISSYCWDETGRANRDWAWDEKPRHIAAVQADTGALLWKRDCPVAPLTLGADAASVYLHDGEKILCLDRKTGKQVWASAPVARRTPIPTGFGPTLVVTQDVVLFSGGNRSMSALAAKTGKTLWTAPHPPSGHMSPEDLLVVGGLAWAGAIAGGGDSGVFTGRDLLTGEVKSQFAPDVKTYWFHHRCYRSKATDRYLLPSRTGIEFIDFQQKHWEAHHWVRGGCLYGIMPCNGLVYAPPHSCACYLESKLYGFNALAPAPEGRGSGDEGRVAESSRLEKGPAFGPLDTRPSTLDPSSDWPTFRHDPARSGHTTARVPIDLKPAWQAELGGTLSSVVVADGKLFVASVDTHTLYALDADSGKTLWTYTAGGRIDSPPTLYQGRALFGSADGWVYCLRAADGALAWRFRAAPEERRVVAFEQLESAWPVSGSVLVQNGVACCVAGRSMFLDGGLRLLRLDPKTGQKLSETILDERDPETGQNLQTRLKGLTMPVALPDVLSSDGRHLYMRSQRFDLEGKREELGPIDVAQQVGEGEHLFAVNGFLDGTWFHRSYMMYGRSIASGWGAWFRAGHFVPAGRLLVFDDASVYGYGRRPEHFCQSSVLEYQLFAADKEVKEAAIRRVAQANRQMDIGRRSISAADWRARQAYPLSDLSAATYKWLRWEPPLHVRAMVLADDTLFIAGPPDVVNERDAFARPDDPKIQAGLAEQEADLDGKEGGLLWVVSALDGEEVASYFLDSPPVWDAMAAAGGRLYLSTIDGKVLCLGGR